MKGRISATMSPSFVAVIIATAALAGGVVRLRPALAQETMPPASSDEMASPGDQPSPAIEFPHLPKLIVEAIPSYGTAPLTVGFLVSNANPTSSPFVSYRWTFGDGQFSTLPPTLFFHTYQNPGSYVIEVTGTTADGLNSTGLAGVVVH